MSEGREGMEGVQEETGLEVTETEGTETEGVAEETKPDELDGTESIRELAQKAYDKETGKTPDGSRDEGQKDGKPEKEAQTARAGAEGQEGQVKGQNEPWLMQPPARLSAKEKEVFNRLPKQLKPAVARMFAGIEGKFTQTQTEYARALGETKHLLEAVRPYYAANPDLAEAGFTEAGFVTALVAKHAKLANPKTSRAEYIKLGKELGIDPSALSDGNTGEKQQTADISNHPQFLALQNQVSQLTGLQQQSLHQRIEATGSQIATEMQSVIDEKDQFGRYRYPELHEQAFLQATKPLVSALAATMPYAEALKRAWMAMTGNSAQLNQTGLPANNNTQNRAMSAAVSVRGRSAAQGAPGQMPGKIPDNTRDIAQMAYEQLVRGV